MAGGGRRGTGSKQSSPLPLEEDLARPSGSSLGFYDVFVALAGWAWVTAYGGEAPLPLVYGLGLAFGAIQVVDMAKHSHPWSAEWMLRGAHHMLLLFLMGGGAYSLALVFLRTHLYIVVALNTDARLIPWISTVLCADELYLCYAIVFGQAKAAWVDPYAPHCVALLVIRPVLLRLVLDPAAVRDSPRLKTEFAVRFAAVTVACADLAWG